MCASYRLSGIPRVGQDARQGLQSRCDVVGGEILLNLRLSQTPWRQDAISDMWVYLVLRQHGLSLGRGKGSLSSLRLIVRGAFLDSVYRRPMDGIGVEIQLAIGTFPYFIRKHILHFLGDKPRHSVIRWQLQRITFFLVESDGVQPLDIFQAVLVVAIDIF